MIKNIIHFCDKLEDRVRGYLSHYPIPYAIFGSIGVVLFWRGVWHTVDFLMTLTNMWQLGYSEVDWSGILWWDGPLSLVVGTVILLLIGIFVSNFIGNEIIITGLRREKKVAEKTEIELRTEIDTTYEIKQSIKTLADKIESLERAIKK